MRRLHHYAAFGLLAVGFVLLPSPPSLDAQETKASSAAPAIVTFTTQEDHRNMMEQLGITRLRPGPSGNPSAPNSANYDESLANPFPNLPDVLTLKNGERVTTPEMWWEKRRPEIVEDFEREVYGRTPPDVPAVTWTVTETRETTVGEIPIIEKQLQGSLDNSRCPEIEVNIAMTVATPKDAPAPVPVLMMYSFGFGPGRGGPPGGARRGSAAPGGFAPRGPSRSQMLIEAGWGYALISPASIQADNGAGLTRGIIGLTNRGQPRKPDDWGALRAWAWGASRGLDYLETDPAVDAKRVGIEGVSRYGKAALVAMAFDQRFAMALVGSSGEGGAKLHRRNFGEAVENLTGSGEYHWMAGNFLKYGAEESKFGSRNAGDIPVDSHQLIALCAPRLTFISYGVPERGDAKWLDQQGSFMAAVAAGPVFRLLGAKDLGVSDDYQNAKMPAVNVGRLDGELAWRQHDGGHTDTPNIEHFIRWAETHFGKQEPANTREQTSMNDQKRIQGTWRVVSGERHGTPFSEEATKNVQLVFSGDTLTTKTRNGDNRVTFKLNPEKSPREIDVDMDGQPGLGIYALEGDDLRILHGEVGDPRPTGFDTQDRSRLTLLVLRRE